MDEELSELEKKSETDKKIRQKKRIRGVLFVITGLLTAYVGFLGVQSIVDAVRQNKSKNSDILCVLDKGEKDSLKIYDKFIAKDDEGNYKKTDAADFATYGRYLLVSNSRVTVKTPHMNMGEDTKANLSKLVSADSKEAAAFGESKLSFTLGDKLDQQIDLFSLDKGEYIIFNDFIGNGVDDREVYHYTGVSDYSETIYSFPDNSGNRKKITIEGKASSPALVITVSNVSSLPKNTYDILILNSQNLSLNSDWDKELAKNYSVKTVSSLEEAYQYDAGYAINVTSGGTVTTSNYVSEANPSETIVSENEYNGLDKDNFIRELGGYVFHAGYGIAGDDDIAKASLSIHSIARSDHKGKYAMTVGNDVSLATISGILGKGNSN